MRLPSSTVVARVIQVVGSGSKLPRGDRTKATRFLDFGSFSTSPRSGWAGRCGWTLHLRCPGTRPGYSARRHVDETRLLLACEELRSRRLNRSRPLWEMWFVPGLAGGQVGMFVKVHHSVADGGLGIAALGAFFDTVPLIPGDDNFTVVAEGQAVTR